MKQFAIFLSYACVAVNNSILVIHDTTGVVKTLEFEAGKESTILSLCLCPIGVNSDNCWIIAAFANKWVCCWELSTGSVVGSVLLKKGPTSLTVCESSPAVVLVTDKFGDVFALSCPTIAKPVLMAGHTSSIITDINVSPCGKYLATCDRDEKIRIGVLPLAKEIQSYCLHHTSIVSSLDFLGASYASPVASAVNKESVFNKLLLSCGWDYSVCLWEYTSGKLVDMISYDGYQELGFQQHAASKVATDEAATATTDLPPPPTDDNEGPVEKVYDANSGGNFPFKVISNLSGSAAPSSIFAVLFKDSTTIKLYSIMSLISDDSQAKVDQANCMHLDLGDGVYPCDAVFYSSDVGETLIFLTSSPSYMKVFFVNRHDEIREVNDAATNTVQRWRSVRCELSEATADNKPWNQSMLTALRHDLITKGADFLKSLSPVLSTCLGEVGGDNAGLAKHTLDRPFATMRTPRQPKQGVAPQSATDGHAFNGHSQVIPTNNTNTTQHTDDQQPSKRQKA